MSRDSWFCLIGTVCLLCIIIILLLLFRKLKRWWRRIILKRFNNFIREKIIPTFNQQLHGEKDDHFAVLMLASTMSLWQLSRMSFKRVNTSFFHNPFCDSSFPSYPREEELKNYIVARADSQNMKHPEIILLERFDELKEAYKKHYEKKVCCVLLYSWKLPCRQCADEIIEMFGNTPINVVIVYSKDSNASTVNKLRSHNFNVMEVPYNRFSQRQLNCCVQ